MHQEIIIIDGKKMGSRRSGEGETVVLLHGFGEDGTVWEKLYHAFPGYRLLIPDLPGSGASESTIDMSMEGLANTLAHYLNHHGVHQCILIGHSMGGYVALAMAEKYPDMLKGFGLFHSTAYADSDEKKDIRKKGIQFMQQHGAFEFLKSSIPNLFSPVTKQSNSQLIEQQIAASRNFSAETLVSYYMSMMKRPDRKEILKTTSLPVLFILGKYDTTVPLSDGLQLCYLPDLSYIHILENSAHMGMMEEAILSSSILNKYLKSTAT